MCVINAKVVEPEWEIEIAQAQELPLFRGRKMLVPLPGEILNVCFLLKRDVLLEGGILQEPLSASNDDQERIRFPPFSVFGECKHFKQPDAHGIFPRTVEQGIEAIKK